MNEVTGVDLHNILITGGVCKTITAGYCNNEHIPCVLIRSEHERADSIYNRNDTEG